jgi:hypothetical protein
MNTARKERRNVNIHDTLKKQEITLPATNRTSPPPDPTAIDDCFLICRERVDGKQH